MDGRQIIINASNYIKFKKLCQSGDKSITQWLFSASDLLNRYETGVLNDKRLLKQENIL